MSRLTRDKTADLVSRDQILRRERGLENVYFSCSADHKQDWQPYPVDLYSCLLCVRPYLIITHRVDMEVRTTVLDYILTVSGYRARSVRMLFNVNNDQYKRHIIMIL